MEALILNIKLNNFYYITYHTKRLFQSLKDVVKESRIFIFGLELDHFSINIFIIRRVIWGVNHYQYLISRGFSV